MKYEMIFGDENLFDGAPEDAEAVFKNQMLDSRCAYYRLSHGHERYISGEWVKVPSIDSQTFSAMRRIIPQPKRWTRAEKDAERQPEVGEWIADPKGHECEFVGCDLYSGDDDKYHMWHVRYSTSLCASFPSDKCKPIESPEEKAARLREEWCSNALDSASILSGMREYELKRLGGYIGNIYDALLSGELQTPKKGD